MKKKMKLAILTLLGFSTACSTVKHQAQNEATRRNDEPTRIDETVTTSDSIRTEEVERIKLMYGIRPPKNRPKAVQRDIEIDPVAEAPVDSLDVKVTPKEKK